MDIFDSLYELLYANYGLALIASFTWGILSIVLSPCHLSSIPLVIGFINTQAGVTAKKSFTLSLVFALGIMLTIALIGVITASLGGIIGDTGVVGNYLVAAVFFVVGLYFFDVIDLSRLGLKIGGTKQKGLLAALVLGVLFGVGLGPCTFAFMAPVLGVVFEIGRTNLPNAVILMMVFAVGHCLVIVIAGTLAGKVQQYLDWSGKSRSLKYVRWVCGVLVIFGGLYFIYQTL